MSSSSTASHSMGILKDNSITCRNPNLSHYETIRAQKIERNTNRMLDLGLLTPAEAQAQIETAWKIMKDSSKRSRNDSFTQTAAEAQRRSGSDDGRHQSHYARVPDELIPFLNKVFEKGTDFSSNSSEPISI